MKPQLANLDFELLHRLQAGDILSQNVGQIALQPMDIANTDEAGSEKKCADNDGGYGDSKEEFSVHGLSSFRPRRIFLPCRSTHFYCKSAESYVGFSAPDLREPN